MWASVLTLDYIVFMAMGDAPGIFYIDNLKFTE